MGFKTFNDFWSEEYDGYEDRDRFELIIKLINTLAAKSQKELTEMYWNMKSVLDHNFELLKTQSYIKCVTQID